MFKPKFYAKCKSSIKTTKTRIEALKKKKGSVVKYLKNDIAELIRTGLDYNAYCRAEGFMIEQDRLSCYRMIDQFVGCVSNKLSAMQKQRECPEECGEAVASLIYATARFSEFPELRDLRTLFIEKYGSSLEPFTSKEFVEKLNSRTVTKEMKFQLLRDIAQELSIDWHAKSLEQKLFTQSTPKQDSTYDDSYNQKTGDDEYKQKKSRDEVIQEERNKLNDMEDYIAAKRDERDIASQARKGVINGGNDQRSSSSDDDEEVSVGRRYFTDQDSQLTSSTSVDSCSEDEVNSRRPLYPKFIPPYFKQKAEREESSLAEESSKKKNNIVAFANNHKENSVQEGKPKPISVRRNLKPPPGRENIGSMETNLALNAKLNGKKQEEPGDEMDEEEKKLDELLMHYTKNFYGEPSKGKPYLKPPPSQYKPENVEGIIGQRNTKLAVPPGRAASMPAEPTMATESTKSHARHNSLQPETLPGHVHPKLPEYDDLAAQIAVLKAR